jgi:hypothetical protein
MGQLADAPDAYYLHLEILHLLFILVAAMDQPHFKHRNI